MDNCKYICKKTLIYKCCISMPLSYIISYLYWRHIQFSILFTIIREVISMITYIIFEKIYLRFYSNKLINKILDYYSEDDNIIFNADYDYDKEYEYNINNYDTFNYLLKKENINNKK